MGTEAKRSSKAGKQGRVSSAAALIAAAQSKSIRTSMLSEHGVEHLRELCDYNDTARHSNRVTKADTRSSLRRHFGWHGGDDALDTVCREQLGRESFARKGGAK
jgi:hypothetical protein